MCPLQQCVSRLGVTVWPTRIVVGVSMRCRARTKGTGQTLKHVMLGWEKEGGKTRPGRCVATNVMGGTAWINRTRALLLLWRSYKTFMTFWDHDGRCRQLKSLHRPPRKQRRTRTRDGEELANPGLSPSCVEGEEADGQRRRPTDLVSHAVMQQGAMTGRGRPDLWGGAV